MVSNKKTGTGHLKRLNQTLKKAAKNATPTIPNVELQNPTTYNEDDGLTSILQMPTYRLKLIKEQEEQRSPVRYGSFDPFVLSQMGHFLKVAKRGMDLKPFNFYF